MILAPLVAFWVSLALQPGVIWLLRRRAVLDHPTDRSSHSVPTPRGGGLAVILGILAGLGLSATLDEAVAPLVGGVVLYGLIGAVEDLHGVDARLRFVTQVLAGLFVGVLVAVLAGVSIWLVVPLLAVWLTGYANSFNFMDGVNGISAMNATVAGFVLAWIGDIEGIDLLTLGGPVIAGASLGFLPWNAFKPKVFLGDSGAYALGAGIATLTGYAIVVGVPLEAAVGPMALYLADTLWTLQRRIRAGEVWHEAHRTHSYQRLTDLGWSHLQIALFTAAVSLAVSLCGAVSLHGTASARIAADLLGLALLVGYLNAPGFLGRRTKGMASP